MIDHLIENISLSEPLKKYGAETLIEKLQNKVTENRWQRIQDVTAKRTSHISIACEGLYDRGNVSAVMRTAEAFGFHNFHIIELQEKFKESKRVTMGAHKWLNTKKWTSTKECVEHLKSHGHKIYVTHLKPDATPLQDIKADQPLTLFFGNEKQGASEELIELADDSVYIPMQGFVESFNISVAAAISAFYLSQLDYPRVDEETLKKLRAHYLVQSLDSWEAYLK